LTTAHLKGTFKTHNKQIMQTHTAFLHRNHGREPSERHTLL